MKFRSITRPIAAIVALALVSLTSACIFNQSEDEGPTLPGPSEIRELVDEVSGIHAISVSPDGSKLVYISFIDPVEGRVYFVVRDARNGRAMQMLEYTTITAAIWGPDSTSIAYLSFNDEKPSESIGLLKDEALEMQNVVELLSYDVVSTPAWSPDGRFIAFWSRKYLDEKTVEATLWMVRPDGTDLKKLYGGPGVRTVGMITGDIAWSRDSGKLLFTMSNGESVNAFLIERRGGNPKNLTSNHLKVSDLFWSPNGKKIGYAAVDKADPFGSPKLWVMNADGSHKTALGPLGRPVGWIPNSRELTYIVADNSQNSPELSSRLEAIDVNTKTVRILAEEENADIVTATVSRDSRVFYVTADQEGQGKIMIVE